MNRSAGKGSGIKRIWMHYRDQLRRLQAVMDQVQLPAAMRGFDAPGERQLTLF